VRIADADCLAAAFWVAGVVPALALLGVEIAWQLLRREPGVDIIAGPAMARAVALGENLAGVVVALMFTGGNMLEEFARRRAYRELNALLARRPRIAHREAVGGIEDLPIKAVQVGDRPVVKGGEVPPVDGMLVDPAAVVDESALNGESGPVEYRDDASLRSGTLNAGGPLRVRADATAANSTYSDLVRLVEAAQQDKAPFVRLANRGRWPSWR
jgi:cation transport ATPase